VLDSNGVVILADGGNQLVRTLTAIPVPTFTVGGSITISGGAVSSGLNASGLVLAGAGAPLTVPTGANSFTFAAAFAQGSSYSVFIRSHPSGMFCSVSNGDGTVTETVTSIKVDCIDAPFRTSTLTFVAKGLVYRIDDSNLLLRNFLGTPVAIGDPVTFTVTYPINASDTLPNDPTTGVYYGFYGGESSVTMKIGANAPITKPVSDTQSTFFQVHTSASTAPGYNFQGNDNDTCSNCLWESIQLVLSGSSLITSDALTTPSLDSFPTGPNNRFMYLWVNLPGNAGGQSFVHASVESLE
jgi:hypothetical protein